MTTITIGILMGCLAFCWYVMYKQSKLLKESANAWVVEQETNKILVLENKRLIQKKNILDIEVDKLDKQAFELYEELKAKSKNIKELCRREDKVLEAWAESKCNKHINIWVGHVRENNRPQYVVYEIKGIEVISRYGTASKMWELVNSNKEIYTDYKKAQKVLRKQLEKGLQGEKEKQQEPHTVEYGVEDVYLKGEITEAE